VATCVRRARLAHRAPQRQDLACSGAAERGSGRNPREVRVRPRPGGCEGRPSGPHGARGASQSASVEGRALKAESRSSTDAQPRRRGYPLVRPSRTVAARTLYLNHMEDGTALLEDLRQRLRDEPLRVERLFRALTHERPPQDGAPTIDVTASLLWSELLEFARVLYGIGDEAPLPSQQPQTYVDNIVAIVVPELDLRLHYLYDNDSERINAIRRLAAIVSAELVWSQDNQGRPPPPCTVHALTLPLDEKGHLGPSPDHWDPGVLDEARIAALIAARALEDAQLDEMRRQREFLVESSGESVLPLDAGPIAVYDDLLLLSAQGYEEHLANLEAHRDPRVRRTANQFALTYRMARKHRAALDRDDVLINPNAVRNLIMRDHRSLFVNQWELGLGCDSAPILVLGAEHAYEPADDTNLVNFCLESIGSGVVWLTSGAAAITQALSDGAVCAGRPFHVHPNDYYHVGDEHTWANLATAIGFPNQHAPRQVPGLGAFCYQIELSAYAARSADDSQPPTPSRLAFLRSIVARLRNTARVLLIHGSRSSRSHERARFELATCFLGISAEPQLSRPHPLSESQRPVSVADYAGRRVIRTRALSNQGITLEFLNKIAYLVWEGIPGGKSSPEEHS